VHLEEFARNFAAHLLILTDLLCISLTASQNQHSASTIARSLLTIQKINQLSEKVSSAFFKSEIVTYIYPESVSVRVISPLNVVCFSNSLSENILFKSEPTAYYFDILFRVAHFRGNW